MKAILFTVITLIAAWPIRAEQPLSSYYNTPLSLRVMVRFSREKDDPVRAAYLYRKLREVPNVTLVREAPDFFLDVYTSTTKTGTATMVFVVLKPAAPVFRDVVADRTEARLRIQNVDAWHEAGNLIREEVMKIPGAYFYKGVVGYTGPTANGVIDGAVKSFEVSYVEPARVQDQETKDQIRALQERMDAAQTPEEKRAAAEAITKYLGLPVPPLQGASPSGR